MPGRSVLTSFWREARLLALVVVQNEPLALSSANREEDVLLAGSSANRDAFDRWAEFPGEFSGEEPNSDMVVSRCRCRTSRVWSIWGSLRVARRLP